MLLATSEEIRRLDRVAIDDFGLPGIVLMENASQSIARAIFAHWPDWPAPRTAAILAGPGQNGGDGWALARILSGRGFRVRVYLVRPEGKEVRGDAAINMGVAEKLGIPIEIVDDQAGEPPVWEQTDLVVDALFGTGLDRPLKGPAERVLAAAGAAKAALGDRLRICAVDLPSGLSGDTGELWGPPLPADLTVTLGAPKVGLYLKRGPELSGHIVVGDIGLTPPMIERAEPRGRLTDPDELRPFIPIRPPDGHKGTFGHTLLAGGARGKTGALVLAALGAIKSGAALITALHPASLSSVMETKLTSAMTLELPEDQPGELSAEAGDLILKYASGRQALGLGPGLGLNEGAEKTVLKVVAGAGSLPLVLDADALTHLAGRLELVKACLAAVLTPHPGEAARLLGVTTAEIQADRLGAARALAERSGAIVALKGHHTIIAAPDGRFHLNPTGGPALAVGGSGDVLTGLIAGLLTNGAAPFTAAFLGVWLHGRAGDLAAAATPRGLTPETFAAKIPSAWLEVVG